MHKYIKILSVVALLAAAAIPAMCHAGDKDKAAQTSEKTVASDVLPTDKASPIPPGAPANSA